MVVGWVSRMTWTIVPSWMLVRRPIRMACTSPRTTTFIQTLLSWPMATSPMTCADASTNALSWTTGSRPWCARSIRSILMHRGRHGPHGRIRDPELLEIRRITGRVVVELLHLGPVLVHGPFVQPDRRLVLGTKERLVFDVLGLNV